MDMTETAARLRRTFHYPTDDPSANGGEISGVLDEEEQENLIHALAEQNASTNQQYQILLLALPILSSIPYILALFQPSTLLVALLGLTSLTSTVYLLLRLPITETGIPILDAWARPRPHAGSDAANETSATAPSPARAGPRGGPGARDPSRRRRRTSSMRGVGGPRRPLDRHLPLLNLGLCAVLVASGVLADRAAGPGEPRGNPRGRQFGWLGLGNVPAIVNGVVVAAKMVMASVNPESELRKLRYECKGA